MGARGELFTTQVTLENRSYFFNVKENRTNDVFLQEFLQGLEKSLSFIDKEQKSRKKAAREKKAAKEAKYGKKVYVKKEEEGRKPDGIKRTGRVHVVSKRTAPEQEEQE